MPKGRKSIMKKYEDTITDSLKGKSEKVDAVLDTIIELRTEAEQTAVSLTKAYGALYTLISKRRNAKTKREWESAYKQCAVIAKKYRKKKK